MPNKKKNRKSRPNTQAGKSQGGLLPLSYIPPQSRRVKLCYAAGVQVTESGAGTGGTRFFRMNSIYDVDTTLGSTSVAGFAEWGNFFANYRVWKTRARFEGNASGGTTQTATVCLVPQAYTATLPSSSNTWPVQPYTVKQTINMYNTGGNNLVKLDVTWDIPSILRVTRGQFLNEQNFTANTSSNPSTQVYFALTVQGQYASTATVLTGQIYVAFMAEFFNPITVSI